MRLPKPRSRQLATGRCTAHDTLCSETCVDAKLPPCDEGDGASSVRSYYWASPAHSPDLTPADPQAPRGSCASGKKPLSSPETEDDCLEVLRIPGAPTSLRASMKRRRDSRLTVLSAFTGAGGLDVGLELAGFRTIACIENNAQ